MKAKNLQNSQSKKVNTFMASVKRKLQNAEAFLHSIQESTKKFINNMMHAAVETATSDVKAVEAATYSIQESAKNFVNNKMNIAVETAAIDVKAVEATTYRIQESAKQFVNNKMNTVVETTANDVKAVEAATYRIQESAKQFVNNTANTFDYAIGAIKSLGSRMLSSAKSSIVNTISAVQNAIKETPDSNVMATNFLEEVSIKANPIESPLETNKARTNSTTNITQKLISQAIAPSKAPAADLQISTDRYDEEDDAIFAAKLQIQELEPEADFSQYSHKTMMEVAGDIQKCELEKSTDQAVKSHSGNLEINILLFSIHMINCSVNSDVCFMMCMMDVMIMDVPVVQESQKDNSAFLPAKQDFSFIL